MYPLERRHAVSQHPTGGKLLEICRCRCLLKPTNGIIAHGKTTGNFTWLEPLQQTM